MRKCPKIPFEDVKVLEEGWRVWSKKLIDGIRLQEVDPTQNKDLVTYTFFLPQGWNPLTRDFKKVRCIADERPRNFTSPLTEHLYLHSHETINKLLAIAFGMDGDG